VLELVVDEDVLEVEVGPVEVEVAYGPVEGIAEGPGVEGEVAEDGRREGRGLGLQGRDEDEELEGEALDLSLRQDKTLGEGVDSLLELELLGPVEGLQHPLVEHFTWLRVVIQKLEVVAVASYFIIPSSHCNNYVTRYCFSLSRILLPARIDFSSAIEKPFFIYLV
jgi:hypothetical protein